MNSEETNHEQQPAVGPVWLIQLQQLNIIKPMFCMVDTLWNPQLMKSISVFLKRQRRMFLNVQKNLLAAFKLYNDIRTPG